MDEPSRDQQLDVNPSSVKARFKTIVESRWANVVAGGSVRPSAGT